MKLFMLIDIKMPTIVGIVTFIREMYATYEILKEREGFNFQHFNFYGQLIFHAQLSSA